MRSNKTLKIYRLLLKRFGGQGWWPTTPIGEVESVYHTKNKNTGALTESQKFEICVGALLVQNTAWTNVVKALSLLNKNKLMSPEMLLRKPFGSLAKLVRSSGYFRQKAKKLKIFSKFLVSQYKGKVGLLLKGEPAALRDELLEIYGMGPETVDSILLYAGGMPIFVVDAYTRRIGQRVGLFDTNDYAEVQKFFQKNLKVKSIERAGIYNEYHALLVELAKRYCKTKPECGGCPIRNSCKTGLVLRNT